MICGVDEAGRGSALGPLVVGAVYSESDAALIDIGVRDSKRLSPKARERMYEQITAVCGFCVVCASASEIDDRRKAMSLNDIELGMFVEACSSRPASIVYADCPDVDEAGFSRDMRRMMKGAEVIARHKADDVFPVVSAASIVAKVTRDRMVEDIRSELGADIGSGYPSDSVTMGFIEKWIRDNGVPPPHTRCSWEPVRRMMTVSKNTRISDW
ncbi:MAG: ribonuclease HII [Methanomassiliicoccaceae archaeon]|nr:ribonuclease HII [Methanomassiliicoccaceae archaeon]MCL2148391.1 ribonuclease HII [Methanomassiliicoccaceae archaeon]